MLYPSVLVPYLQMYNYGYNIVIEAIMFGRNADRYISLTWFGNITNRCRSLTQPEQHHEVVNYWTATQNTAMPSSKLVSCPKHHIGEADL